MARRWTASVFRSRGRARRRAASGRSRSAAASAQSWWAKRWIAVLESFQLGARLQRGRSYARQGQVLSITVETGVGDRARCRARARALSTSQIEVKTLSKADWCEARRGGRQPGDLRRQAAGRRDAAGHRDGVREPRACRCSRPGISDLKTDCSCPDWSNPCKHIAAVYYLLGEEFDRDPFLIFQLRGMGREEFLGLLGEANPAPPVPAAEAELPPEPLPASPASFWNGGALPENLVDSASRRHRREPLCPSDWENFHSGAGARIFSVSSIRFIERQRRRPRRLWASSGISDRAASSRFHLRRPVQHYRDLAVGLADDVRSPETACRRPRLRIGRNPLTSIWKRGLGMPTSSFGSVLISAAITMRPLNSLERTAPCCPSSKREMRPRLVIPGAFSASEGNDATYTSYCPDSIGGIGHPLPIR